MTHKVVSKKDKKYKKILIISITAIAICSIGYWGYKYFTKNQEQNMPIPAVEVVKVNTQDIYPQSSFVAKIESKDKVGLRARVQGFLQQRLFQEGDLVKEGQPLFIIEPVNFEASVREAQANVTKAEAQVKNAKSQFDRTKTLFKTKDVSEAKLDETQAAYHSAEASLEQAKAKLDLAKKDLEYTTIVSPMDGKIGESTYSVGELIGPASNTLAQVVRVDPIDAVFSVSENEMLNLQKNFPKSGKVAVDFIKADGTVYQQEGQIDFVDVTLDEAMNTLKIKASFPNKDGELISGQYGRIMIKSLEAKPEIVIPMKAVQQDMMGTYVYLVDNNNQIVRREVIRGTELEGFNVVIDDGLNVGDTIVTEGFQKIAPQMTVKPIFEPTNEQPK
ncbi:MAG: efflux RND transporter periplasmic adaptor subunit [Alphaproteobacteria bacterium]|nr:efflux RND transporter periplasmic adaptor subunit [Alphaproteobacteria bacterium]